MTLMPGAWPIKFYKVDVRFSQVYQTAVINMLKCKHTYFAFEINNAMLGSIAVLIITLKFVYQNYLKK